MRCFVEDVALDCRASLLMTAFYAPIARILCGFQLAACPASVQSIALTPDAH